LSLKTSIEDVNFTNSRAYNLENNMVIVAGNTHFKVTLSEQ